MQTIWLARHANREDFVDPDWATTADRPHDPGLSSDGIEQAGQLANRATTLRIDRLFSSPFLRTIATAHPIAKALDTSLYLEPGLGEWLNSDWFDSAPDTRPLSALTPEFPRIDPHHQPCRQPAYPESKHRALARIGAAARCLTDRHDGETLLLVGHGITVQGALHGLVGKNVPDPGCPLASLTKVVGEGDDWHIEIRNDTSHLENGTGAADRLV